MTYLFGDSSPSDLEFDYIDFLRDALDYAVQVLAADERMSHDMARAILVRKEGEAEAARLEALGAAQAGAIEGFDIGAPESATALCAGELLRGAAETVRAAIEKVRNGVNASVGKLEEESRRDREKCAEALAAFLRRHDLPQMTSELRLQQLDGNRYAARLYVRALGNLMAVVDLEIPPSHVLSTVARVDKVMERLEVHAPESGGWLRKEVKLRAQRLDKEFITAVVANARETLIHLRAAADGSGVGFDLTIREDGSRVSLQRVGEANDAPPFELDDTDSGRLRDLRDKLLAGTAELRRARRGLLEASFGDTALSELRDQKSIVERLVAAMAPVVREIARRSLAPTELVLKRQTGDGRREEIFVSRKDLQVKLKGLGAASRAVFAPLDLGELPAEPSAAPMLKPRATEAARPIELKPGDIKSVEKKEPQRPVEKSLFAEARNPEERARSKTPAVGMPTTTTPAKGEPVPLDDSFERLVVSDQPAARKPD